MEQFEDMNNEVMPEKPGRPKTLTVLCVLTFIWSSLGALGSLATPLMKDMFVGMMKNNPDMDEAQFADAMKAFDAGWGYFLLCSALAIGSIIGAVLMWKLRKTGFHVYAFSNLALLFVPTLVLGMPLSWVAIFITAAFIVMYGLHLKYMN
jgi:hypothetical protein